MNPQEKLTGNYLKKSVRIIKAYSIIFLILLLQPITLKPIFSEYLGLLSLIIGLLFLAFVFLVFTALFYSYKAHKENENTKAIRQKYLIINCIPLLLIIGFMVVVIVGLLSYY